VVEQLEDRLAPSATLTTNQQDYAPGSTAYFKAEGFLPGETLQFQVLHIDGTANTGADNQPWLVTDGGVGDLDGMVNGSVSTSWFVGSDNIGSTLEVIATGLTSGLTTEATFTDSNARVSSNLATGDSFSVTYTTHPVNKTGTTNTTTIAGGGGLATISAGPPGDSVDITASAFSASGLKFAGWAKNTLTTGFS
jgi:hypothetical protein